MKVAYISHSLVADRQRLFQEALDREVRTRGGKGVSGYFPAQWGALSRDGGLEVLGAPDQQAYTFSTAAWRAIKQGDPDVMLVQQEPYTMVAYQTAAMAKRMEVPYVIFTWDNLNQPVGPGKEVLENAAHVVCGNKDAQALVQKAGVTKTSILPQVGFDTELFAPRAYHPEPRHDVLFMGRKDPMKGEAVLDAAKRPTWRVLKGHEAGFLAYEGLWERYHQARVQCTPSLDVPGRPREQFAPATSVEGLLCGTPLVTTKQSAIHEWLHDCPKVVFTEPGDPESLRAGLDRVLDESWDGFTARLLGRTFCIQRFGNDQVAKQYANLLEAVQ